MPPPERLGADVEMRRRILETVNRYPGLHMREIQRRIGTSVHLVEHHLNVLERLALVTSQEQAGYRRFFPASAQRAPLDADARRWLSLLRQSLPLGIALHLLDRERSTHGEIADVVPVTKSTLTYHLKNMEQAGLIARDADRSIRLADAPRVLAILRAYRPTPDLLAAWADMWTTIIGLLDADDDGAP